MIKQIGISKVKKYIKTWTDSQLLLYIDTLKKLKSSEDVFATVLWNDVSLLLEMALLECADRLRALSYDDV
mgnify:CR=1 FL=1